MNIGITIASMTLLAIITFAYRFFFISSFGRPWAKRIPQNLLNLLAPATFSAIIANSILASGVGTTEFDQKLMVAGASMLVAYLTRNVVITLVFGLALLNIIQR